MMPCRWPHGVPILGSVLLALLCLLPAAAAAGGAAPPQPPPLQERWVVTSDFMMYHHAPAAGHSATYCLGLTARGEETLDVCESRDGRVSNYEVVFLEGSLVLHRGGSLDKANVAQTLDGPMLEVKFVLELLRQVFPGGPREITDRSLRVLRRADQGVVLYGDGGSLTLKAPWAVRAEVWPSPSGGLDFHVRWAGGPSPDLEGPEAEEAMGHLGPAQPLAPLSPSFKLKDWTAYRVLPSGSGTRPYRLPMFATLADLRQALPFLPLGEE